MIGPWFDSIGNLSLASLVGPVVSYKAGAFFGSGRSDSYEDDSKSRLRGPI